MAIDITTGAALEDSYPVGVRTELASIVGVQVLRVRDVATPGAVRYEAGAVASWSASGGLLSVGYLTGLEASSRYIITLEVIGA